MRRSEMKKKIFDRHTTNLMIESLSLNIFAAKINAYYQAKHSTVCLFPSYQAGVPTSFKKHFSKNLPNSKAKNRYNPTRPFCCLQKLEHIAVSN